MNQQGRERSKDDHAGVHAGGASRLKTSVHATAHCLLGCSIGEFAGLAIGVTLGLGAVLTVALAVVLAFITGLALAIQPLVRQQGMGAWQALRTIWLGEVVSIAVMEIAMNGVDYAVGGVQVQSMAEPVFWLGFGLALPAGFVAAFPINYWLIGRNLKHGH